MPDHAEHENTPPDPFAVLGLERRFDLSDEAIESAFLARIGAAHPDLAGDGASWDAAALSGARAVLLDPEHRAGALLGLLGGPAASADKSLPDGFLPEIMQLREEIEEDLGGGGDARTRWSVFAEERRSGHVERIAALFAGFGEQPSDDDLRAVRVELNAWRYTERLIEQLDPAYDPSGTDFRG